MCYPLVSPSLLFLSSAAKSRRWPLQCVDLVHNCLDKALPNVPNQVSHLPAIVQLDDISLRLMLLEHLCRQGGQLAEPAAVTAALQLADEALAVCLALAERRKPGEAVRYERVARALAAQDCIIAARPDLRAYIDRLDTELEDRLVQEGHLQVLQRWLGAGSETAEATQPWTWPCCELRSCELQQKVLEALLSNFALDTAGPRSDMAPRLALGHISTLAILNLTTQWDIVLSPSQDRQLQIGMLREALDGQQLWEAAEYAAGRVYLEHVFRFITGRDPQAVIDVWQKVKENGCGRARLALICIDAPSRTTRRRWLLPTRKTAPRTLCPLMCKFDGLTTWKVRSTQQT